MGMKSDFGILCSFHYVQLQYYFRISSTFLHTRSWKWKDGKHKYFMSFIKKVLGLFTTASIVNIFSWLSSIIVFMLEKSANSILYHSRLKMLEFIFNYNFSYLNCNSISPTHFHCLWQFEFALLNSSFASNTEERGRWGKPAAWLGWQKKKREKKKEKPPSQIPCGFLLYILVRQK